MEDKVYCKNCIFLEEKQDTIDNNTDKSKAYKVEYRCMNDACFSVADTPLETITVRIKDYEVLNEGNNCEYFSPNKKNFISSIFGK